MFSNNYQPGNHAGHLGRQADSILDELRPALRSNIASLAECLLGPPNKETRRKSEWRWGSKGGMRVTVSGPKQGACADFDGTWKGDPLALIMRAQHCDFIAAVKFGCDFVGIQFDREGCQEDPARRAAHDAEQERLRAEREAEQEADEGKRIAYALSLWNASVAVNGTAAETYLINTRAIPRPTQGWPDSVRYHPPSGSLILAGTDADGAVRFVQRVRLTVDGRKVDGARVKQTDGVMAGAFVRLPGSAAAPLLLAEGPETALSVWVATGYETRASIGAIARHEPPTSRRVVVCRDDSKPSKPEDIEAGRPTPDAMFDAAVSKWHKTGADIVVATPWAERRRDESDFNDTIQAGGVDAVRARIEAALPQEQHIPPPPVKRLTLNEGHIVTQKAADDLYAAGWAWDKARNQAEATYKAELTASADFDQDTKAWREALAEQRATTQEAARLAMVRPRTDESRAAVAAAKDIARAARERASAASKASLEFRKAFRSIQNGINGEAKAKAIDDAGPYPVHGMRVDLGVGKTEANLQAIVQRIPMMRAIGDKRTIGVAIPRHALGDQQAERLAEKTRGIGISAGVWRSRRAPDPNHPDFHNPDILMEDKMPMCRDLDAVKDVFEVMGDVQKQVCHDQETGKKCPFFDECPYQKQKQARNDVWFFAHELLFNHKPAEIGKIALLAVDESAWKAGLFGIEGPNFLWLATLLSEDATIPGQLIDSGQLGSTRSALSQAFGTMEIPGENAQPLPLLRGAVSAQGITAAAADNAYGLEWLRRKDPAVYPGMPQRKRKDAVKDVVHNKLVAKLGSLWKAVEALLADSGPERSGCLSLGTHETTDGTAPAINIKGRKNVHPSWHVPTLIMDGTMQPDIVRKFWPTMELTADVKVEAPHQHVRQVGDSSYSKAHLKPNEKPNPGDDEKPTRRRGLRNVHAIACREGRKRAGRVLVVAQKDTEAELNELGNLPRNIATGHHNAMAGRDDFKDVVSQLVIGRTAASPFKVEDIAEALTGIAVDRIDGWYPKAPAWREMTDGTWQAAETDRHPDPLAEAVRWSITEGELVQILGRPRGVNRKAANPVDLLVMTNAVLPIPIEAVISKADLEPSCHDLMMAAGGVAFENSTDVAAVYPLLWNTPEAVRQAFGRDTADWAQFVSVTLAYKSILISECHTYVLVRYKRASSRRRANAIVDTSLFPDFRARLVELLGEELAECVVLPVPVPEPDEAAIAAAQAVVAKFQREWKLVGEFARRILQPDVVTELFRLTASAIAQVAAGAWPTHAT
jgi:hypothetical protein